MTKSAFAVALVEGCRTVCLIITSDKRNSYPSCVSTALTFRHAGNVIIRKIFFYFAEIATDYDDMIYKFRFDCNLLTLLSKFLASFTPVCV